MEAMEQAGNYISVYAWLDVIEAYPRHFLLSPHEYVVCIVQYEYQRRRRLSTKLPPQYQAVSHGVSWESDATLVWRGSLLEPFLHYSTYLTPHDPTTWNVSWNIQSVMRTSANMRRASLNKLAIRGIRSFDDKHVQVIEFYSPLTVIVGHNGSGKTVSLANRSASFNVL
jgi:hypothetical protein